MRPGIAFFNDDFEHAIIDVPVFPHSIEQNPNHPSRVMLIPRRAKTCVEFDVVENKIISEIKLNEKHFYGHGCYIPGTDLFYASTYLKSSQDASMVIIDHKKNKILKEIDVPGGAGSHQCAVSKDGKFVIITFSEPGVRVEPSVAWFDVKTGELVNRVFGVSAHAEHFEELNDGNIIYTGGKPPIDKNLFPTVFGHIGPDKKVMNYPLNSYSLKDEDGDIFLGQGVGMIGLENSKRFVVTNLVRGMVYIFDYKNGKLIKHFKIRKPRGVSITNDGKNLLITSIANLFGKTAYIWVIDVEKAEIKRKFSIPNALTFSSHTTKFKLDKILS